MRGWNEGIADAVAYMEDHLTDELSIGQIAKRANVSGFYFQRIFSALCGFTVGEYIRNRRLTLAAQELCSARARVLDIALKYGYESPDSFTRAFIRFHGVSPSAAREPGVRLNAFAPLKIKLTLEGGTMLEYKIVEKEQFTVVGVSRKFHGGNSYEELPAFWNEHCSNSEEMKAVCGTYGICIDAEDDSFDYIIADNYLPWKEVPEGCVTRVIPAGTWAVFPCRGALPKALQDVLTRIWSEWLPSCRAYKLAGSYNVEMYTPHHENPADDYSEIWIPLEKL